MHARMYTEIRSKNTEDIRGNTVFYLYKKKKKITKKTFIYGEQLLESQ